MAKRSSSSSPLVDPKALRLERLRNFSRLMDDAIAIPGTNYRIGLDPIIGLIPGGGDTVGLILSAWIVIEAAQMGASKSALGQMVLNIVLETLVGTVPVVGDVFDVAWKSNTKNIRLLEDHLQVPEVGRSRSRNRGFIVVFILGTILAIALILSVSFLVVRWLTQIFT
jgi:Domain of unknown function (DUF4112)